MVALVCSWHEHHQAVRHEIEGRLDDGHELIVAGHSLIEAYAVLTRLPYPNRLPPAAARDILVDNFAADDVEVVALDTRDYAHILNEAPQREIAGGTIYDAIFIACARKADVDVVLTFNRRHFDRLAANDMTVVVPQEQ
jgi:predicted nucleic acid-binding protein